ncbi:hypothetical protein MAM1_0301d09423 [Mucor ambiguus]|uniref:Uncharacterized protein n=1 Tax=Mucor ambiguus TaxID=91626 RepID=A0A0C9LXA6_9FUNG|nr:hypothetical protein MAM1_0301d09423 [Mucor ambiguus]
MDFIKRFHFIQKFKDNNDKKNNATSLGRQKSKRSIFSHHNNDRLVSSNVHHATYTDSDDDEQDDDDHDEYNSNARIFRQKPLHAITIATTHTNKPRTSDTTSKSKSTRPTHQLYMHHQKNSSSTVQNQLQSLSPLNDVKQHKQLHIAFEGKDTKYTSKYEKQLPEKYPYHKQEKLAMWHPEKDSTLYAPFIERPEIVEDDYIPLPTVTRKYIDPPPDVLLDSIPPFHHTHKRNHTNLLSSDSTTTSTVALSTTTSAIDSLQKPKNKLVVNTKRLDDTSIAEIGAWLSRNSAALETNNVDIQQSIP